MCRTLKLPGLHFRKSGGRQTGESLGTDGNCCKADLQASNKRCLITFLCGSATVQPLSHEFASAGKDLQMLLQTDVCPRLSALQV